MAIVSFFIVYSTKLILLLDSLYDVLLLYFHLINFLIELAARMIGTIKVDGVDTEFESFMFAKIERASGKMLWLIERSIWGPVGKAPEHGVN